MYYQNRQDAGEQLAKKLKKFKNKRKAIVIGLPRGGVPVAKIVADKLDLPLDIIVPRKIGAPFNKEFAIGAITEEGTAIFNDEAKEMVDPTEAYLKDEIEEQKNEAKRRLVEYRGQQTKLDLKGKTAILVDDGVATGATVKAAIQSAKEKKAKKIIVTTPVIPPDTLKEIKKKVDEVIYLEAPESFGAIGKFYKNFEQVSDEEVTSMLNN